VALKVSEKNNSLAYEDGMEQKIKWGLNTNNMFWIITSTTFGSYRGHFKVAAACFTVEMKPINDTFQTSSRGTIHKKRVIK
jgi:hypothetical protein